MKHLPRALACALLLLPLSPRSQELPQGYFCPPLEGDMALSATFAEFRANHFHGGIDIRTGGTTGHPVRAVADGYVERISISPWGGGKILYIKHPNGYTSVYMHLDGYADDIGRYVLGEQYKEEAYAIVREVPEGLLPVRQGQVVAYSGNTGGSGGPHLHFELRRDGRGWNPLHFGLPYTDRLRPTLRGVRLYPLGGTAFEAPADGRVAVGGPFYLGIFATDAAEGSTPRNGIDHLEVTVDGKPFFRYETRAIPLDSTRMVNALIDHPLFAATRQAYLLTRGLPGAEGPWVTMRQGDGILRFEEGTTHRIRIRVYDVAQNCAERVLTVTATAPAPAARQPVGEGCSLHAVGRTRAATLVHGPFRVELPACALYADDSLLLRTQPAAYGTLSPTLGIRPLLHDIPPQMGCTVSVQATPPAHILPRQVVLAHRGRRLTATRTTYADGRFAATVREFGDYLLLADTTAPRVSATAKQLAGNRLRVSISDDLSGIESYRCTLNGSWILAEYDGKTAYLAIDATGKLRKGANTLCVEVADGAGNLTRKQFTLDR